MSGRQRAVIARTRTDRAVRDMNHVLRRQSQKANLLLSLALENVPPSPLST
jgi:hypothetical protein